MLLQERKESFIILGKFLKQFATLPFQIDKSLPNINIDFEHFKEVLKTAEQQNGWFTADNLQYACQCWSEALQAKNIEKWLERYHFEAVSTKNIAIIMAGNIPLVGFHDFLSVLISGHRAVVKLSSDDKVLLPFLAKYLTQINPKWESFFEFTNERINHFDAVIATGSNNTARYFEYYFGKKPHIIRKNRNSVAVLSGKETPEQLHALGKDIFQYFGLGCRSVSKIYVPDNYNFDLFFNAIFPYQNIIHIEKYANNYDYNKAVYLMSLFKLKENGFLILKEDSNYGSPIATLFYEYYSDYESLRNHLKTDNEKIQCVVSQGFYDEEVPFGKTQQPQLWEYADGVDTVLFLTNLSKKT
ncbi:acyl-CoA reductase [Capnocytophaga canimorsus]|uniref:acyl-CoA reductase n=1 Tax=Capnocytophaga canimorsus TaxID=28188 RepID=UPI0038595C96